MPPSLTTPRLLLRPFTEDDIQIAYSVLEDHPDVWKYDPGYQRTFEQRKELIRKYIENNNPHAEGVLAITLLENKHLIGYVGLQHYVLPSFPLASSEVELFYKLGHPWWGFGYAREACQAVLDFAFNTMRLNRIVSVADRENQSSVRLMETLGMKIEPAPQAWSNSVTGTLYNPHFRQ